MERPILGITMGDPASIGAEIVAKALAEPSVFEEKARPFVIGDRNVMADALRISALRLALHPITSLAEARFAYGTLDLLDLANVTMAQFQYGKVSAMCGKASVEYIERGIAMALAAPNRRRGDRADRQGVDQPGRLSGSRPHRDLRCTDQDQGLRDDADRRGPSGGPRVTHVLLRQAIELTKKPRVLRSSVWPIAPSRRWGSRSPKSRWPA